MTDPYFLRSLELSGFRAYLQPKAFDFKKKRCLAIFAPNGKGKSSLVDALEFMLSEDGTIKRLGTRATGNQSGPIALGHNLASAGSLVSQVTMTICSGKDVQSGTRSLTAPDNQMPDVAKVLNECLIVSPIIRGYSLRSFVEDEKPEARYTEVANWLQLTPLVGVQKNIRALRKLVNAAGQDNATIRGIDGQIAKLTAQAVRAWDDKAILTYVNSHVLGPLDPGFSLKTVSASDTGYSQLVARVESEDGKLGLAALRQIRNAAASLWFEGVDPVRGEVVTSGAIPAFDASISKLVHAERQESKERIKAEKAAFQEVWEAAEPLFGEGATTLDICPVCTTPIVETTAGSVEGIRIHIARNLQQLADYSHAKKARDQAAVAVTKAHTQLMTTLAGFIGQLGDEWTSLKDDLTQYQAAVAGQAGTSVLDSTGIVAGIKDLFSSLDQDIDAIQSKQGDHTYFKAKDKVDRILELQAERNLAIRTREQLTKLSKTLTTLSAGISGAIRSQMQSMLDTIALPMNKIYKSIQRDAAIPIRLELPPEDDTNQQRLSILVDFAANRQGVHPSSYLSDSQIHSVALALRMASIRRFNSQAPFMVLDDIVTSYDADHRRAISGLIATEFGDWQIIVATHDERFFNYLKDQLEPNVWHFTRIVEFTRDSGPRFFDDKVSDEMIEERWAMGQSAANEMRQAEEEWLLGICRDFSVSVPIRQLERAYSYERGELSSALAAYLKKAKLEPPVIPGVNNRFLASLQKGEIENFGSHFQEGPYGDGSVGDERTRWEEFKQFRAQFTCKKCEGIRFKRPVLLSKPVCSNEKCEAQFAFS